MTSALVASYEPVARKGSLERLAALPEHPNLTSEPWDQVHAEIQGQFDKLEAELRLCLSGLQTQTGLTRGGKGFVFSYRTFSLPEATLDPVVVGLTFTPAEGGVRVEADASGESRGDFIVELPARMVAPYLEELLRATREFGEQLSRSTEQIAAALRDSLRTQE